MGHQKKKTQLQLLPPAHLMRQHCSPKGLSIRKTLSRSNAGIKCLWKDGWKYEWAPILKRRFPGIGNRLWRQRPRRLEGRRRMLTANSMYIKKSAKPQRPTLPPKIVKEWKKMVLTHFILCITIWFYVSLIVTQSCAKNINQLEPKLTKRKTIF